MLTVSTGSWTNSPTGYTYQWQRCDSGGGSCVDLAGQVASAYTLAAGDVGLTLRARVRAVNVAGISPFTTSAASPVVAASGSGSVAPINNSLPIVTGTAQSGATLSSTAGTWLNSPTSYGYQWQRCSSGGSSCVEHRRRDQLDVPPRRDRRRVDDPLDRDGDERHRLGQRGIVDDCRHHDAAVRAGVEAVEGAAAASRTCA